MQHDRNVKAEVRALVETGVSVPQAAERLNVPARTAYHWAERWRDVALETEHPAVINEWYRLTRRAQDKLHDGLDAIEDDTTALKHMSQLTVLGGVGTDKIQRDREPKYQAPAQVKNVIIVVNAEKPVETIEGESRDVTDG